jgi:hypothetical protein
MTGTIDKTLTQYHDSSNTHIRKVGGYAGPASYVTGGDPIGPGDLGMGRIELMVFNAATNGTLYLYPVWMPSGNSGTVRWLVGTTGVEVAGGVNLSTYTSRFEAIGK